MSAMSNAVLAENGQLVITPNPNTAGAQASCTKSDLAFGAGGVIVEVSAVLNGSAITAFQLGGGATALAMAVQNGMLLAQDAGGTKGMIAYNAVTTRHWRIRPGATGIVFEYGNGSGFTQLATSLQAAQPAYTTQLIAGELGAIANPGTARFDSVNLCPF